MEVDAPTGGVLLVAGQTLAGTRTAGGAAGDEQFAPGPPNVTLSDGRTHLVELGRPLEDAARLVLRVRSSRVAVAVRRFLVYSTVP